MILIFLILCLCIATISDLYFFKIPNALCGIMIFLGIVIAYKDFGIYGVRSAMVGILIPIIVLYFLYYCGMLGAGDIKLFAGVGAFFGSQIGVIILLSFLLNGILALIRMQRYNRFSVRWNYLKGFIRDCRIEGKLLRDYEGEKVDHIHFSIGILGAVILWALIQWL